MERLKFKYSNWNGVRYMMLPAPGGGTHTVPLARKDKRGDPNRGDHKKIDGPLPGLFHNLNEPCHFEAARRAVKNEGDIDDVLDKYFQEARHPICFISEAPEPKLPWWKSYYQKAYIFLTDIMNGITT